MSGSPKLYFDACCFIDMAQHGLSISPKPERTAHVFYLRQFLEMARSKDAEIFTSTLTGTECQFVKDESDKNNHKKIYTPEVKRLFEGMIMSTKSGVTPVMPGPLIVNAARDLLWAHDALFSPMDSLHIATALQQKCDYFITTDTGLDASSVAKVNAMGLAFGRADSLKHLVPSALAQGDLVPKDPSVRRKPAAKPRGKKR